VGGGPEENVKFGFCVAASEAGKTCGQRAIRASLVQPCGFKRLVDVSPFAHDGPGDLCGAHSFLAQRHDARAVERTGAALVNALRFRGVDAGRWRSRMKPSSISATMPSTVKTIRPIGPPVSMAGSSTLRLAPFSSSSWTRLRTPRVFLPKRSNLATMRTSRGEFRTQVPVDLNGPLEPWCSRLRAQQQGQPASI
jgi:hypothetical protein